MSWKIGGNGRTGRLASAAFLVVAACACTQPPRPSEVDDVEEKFKQLRAIEDQHAAEMDKADSDPGVGLTKTIIDLNCAELLIEKHNRLHPAKKDRWADLQDMRTSMTGNTPLDPLSCEKAGVK